MRIIDKYKDYYDSLQRLGIDPDIVFVRKPEIINIPEFKYSYWGLSFYKDKALVNIKKLVIGFCGKTYPALVVDNSFVYNDFELDKLGIFQEVYRHHRHVLLEKNTYFEKLKLIKYNFFEQYKTPIWVLEDGPGKLIINARLKPYFFAKIFPPELAYQTLYQYLAIQNRGEKPIPHVDDKTLAEAKGFNKWSFRKEPK